MTDGPMTDRPRKRQRSVYCTARDQRTIRSQAKAAGKPLSRYLLDLWRADDPESHGVALTAAEQEELRDGVREVRAFAHALMRELPGSGGLSLLAAVSVLARGRR